MKKLILFIAIVFITCLATIGQEPKNIITEEIAIEQTIENQIIDLASFEYTLNKNIYIYSRAYIGSTFSGGRGDGYIVFGYEKLYLKSNDGLRLKFKTFSQS